MTEETGRKLRDLLPGKISEMEETLHETVGSDASLKGHSLAWGFLATHATEALHETLDIDVIGVLAGAWCKVREIREYTDPAKHPAGERSVVQLGTHKFTQTLHPVIKCRVAGQTLLTVPLNLDLKATIETVALGIQDGHIISVGGGSGMVSAQLKYGDKALHKALESRKVKFYDAIPLKAPGFKIA